MKPLRERGREIGFATGLVLFTGLFWLVFGLRFALMTFFGVVLVTALGKRRGTLAREQQARDPERIPATDPKDLHLVWYVGLFATAFVVMGLLAWLFKT